MEHNCEGKVDNNRVKEKFLDENLSFKKYSFKYYLETFKLSNPIPTVAA